MAKRSKFIVKRPFLSAHGGATVFTPCAGHLTRGGDATMMVWYWQESRCRQRRSSAWS